MHALAGAFAFAGRDQEVIRSAVIAEAELAVSLDDFVGIMNSVELAKEELLLLVVFLGDSADLDHSVLHSPQLYNVSKACIDRKVLIG